MNRTERLLDLITYLLNARDPVSWQEIKNHFPEDYAEGIEESNQRKFERDKAELISLGIPIDYQSGSETKKEGYIIEKEQLFLPEIEFTGEESSLLMLAAGAVKDSDHFPYTDQLQSALHKLISVHDQLNPAPSGISIDYSPREEGGEKREYLQKIQEALDRRKYLTIRYHAFSTGETTERRVDPYGLIFRRGQWTLVGWDHLRGDLRNFVIDRVENLDVNLRRPGTPDYQIPADFSLAKYQNQQPWELPFHDPVDVTLYIEPHRQQELAPQLSPIDTDQNLFKVEVTNQSGLISWVLSQKNDVRIVDPPSFQEEAVQRLQYLQ